MPDVHAKFAGSTAFDPNGILAEGAPIRTEKITLGDGQAYKLGHPLKLVLGEYVEVADETEIECFLAQAEDATSGTVDTIAYFQAPIFTANLPTIAGVDYAAGKTALAKDGLFLR